MQAGVPARSGEVGGRLLVRVLEGQCWVHCPWDEPFPATSNPRYPTFKPFPTSLLSQSTRSAIPTKSSSSPLLQT